MKRIVLILAVCGSSAGLIAGEPKKGPKKSAPAARPKSYAQAVRVSEEEFPSLSAADQKKKVALGEASSEQEKKRKSSKSVSVVFTPGEAALGKSCWDMVYGLYQPGSNRNFAALSAQLAKSPKSLEVTDERGKRLIGREIMQLPLIAMAAHLLVERRADALQVLQGLSECEQKLWGNELASQKRRYTAARILVQGGCDAGLLLLLDKDKGGLRVDRYKPIGLQKGSRPADTCLLAMVVFSCLNERYKASDSGVFMRGTPPDPAPLRKMAQALIAAGADVSTAFALVNMNGCLRPDCACQAIVEHIKQQQVASVARVAADLSDSVVIDEDGSEKTPE